ncbi:hypothetical protein H5410_001092 [Solanum commersonii]|uniref:non-specific serine/threonine protein kinase n=1 Tax=Solanum commersonii TaxID=4109 RepID=A0A9J6AZ60_SOLCO|nr:hypothetical protein H5410_001092 [Solanum commersonii]
MVVSRAMIPRILLCFLVVLIHVLAIAARTNPDDSAALQSLKDSWQNVPPNWVGADPCGSSWDGIGCRNLRVVSITLSSMSLEGQLSGDIQGLAELETLDLSYNKELKGSLPQSIGKLTKLSNLILVGCGFSGPIPDTIGSLTRLVFLSLNSNNFIGGIPATIGYLTELYWLDLADNKLTGTIPVSNGSNPGLDMLVHTKHFHFGKNQLSGEIPASLFHSNLSLIHLLVENNKFTGNIPDTLGHVQTMEVLRLDRNSFSGSVPQNLNNLTHVNELHMSNNNFNGLLPNLTGMNVLNYLDMSNNSFNASDFPSWIPNLISLTSLVMENTGLQGTVPASLFSLYQLQTVFDDNVLIAYSILRNNKLNGSLTIDTTYSNQLQLIDVQRNLIESFTQRPGLAGNPFCNEGGDGTQDYCVKSQQTETYSTPPENCLPTDCSSNRVSSPTCKCAFPYTGNIVFRAPSFSNLGNRTTYETLQKSLMQSFQNTKLPVESVSLSNPTKNLDDYLVIHLQVFPSSQDFFNRTGVSGIGFVLSNQTFKPPSSFGPFFFIGEGYKYFDGASSESKKSSSTGIIIGAAVGGSVIAIIALIIGVYAFRQKKRAEDAAKRSDPFASWDENKHSGAVPQLTGARFFSFEELKKWTNNFSETNDIGCGGYGKVYRGTLPNGELVAIKRALQGSMQGAHEFKTEIELLSRVHHKNVVGLAGFCFDQAEQMLVYEYIPNGTLKDGLSGKTGIRLDWMRRLRIAVGAARARVADFGLSKLLGDSDRGHITTQVKGTMGYMDPEYYMTNQLTEKSDVYSFGVVLLEIVTGKAPIEKGRYIVREVKSAMDKSKDMYNLQDILDPAVRAALKCVEEEGANRPSMNEVVKEIENIMEIAGLNPNADSASSSATYEGPNKGMNHPYTDESLFVYSGAYPNSKAELEKGFEVEVVFLILICEIDHMVVSLEMTLQILVYFLVVLIHVLSIAAYTNPVDAAALKSLTNYWYGPSDWNGADPCGSSWEGVGCRDSRVISITLSSIRLKGQLSGDVQGLSELETLDLSYNKDLTGFLPQSIGKLTKLSNLILVGCGFSGSIPDSIGYLTRLAFLFLNSNQFTGRIPATIGYLTELHWLDLSDNQIEGNIPVSNGSNPGLDKLVNTKHFHFGKNQLSGEIPARLFHSNMTLTHLLVENNKFTGVIPDTLGFVQTMKMLDMSRNEFNTSDFPSWIPSLQSLTTLVMEKTGLQGSVPASLFSLHQLQTVILRNNKLNGSLEIESTYSNQLQLIDVQNNLIESFTQKPGYRFQIMLKGNPFCNRGEGTETYCIETQQNETYSTPLQNCLAIECSSNQVSSPACKCAFPYVGDLIFRAPSFLNLGNKATYETLEKSLMLFFQERQLPVESVSLHNPTIVSDDDYLPRFFQCNWSCGIGFVLSNQIFKPRLPLDFMSSIVMAINTSMTSTGSKKSSSTGVIIGATVGGSVLAILALTIGIYAFRQKKRAEDAAKRSDPFASWDSNKHSGAVPQLTGARFFSFEELKNGPIIFRNQRYWLWWLWKVYQEVCLNQLLYPMKETIETVYRGTLPNGELVAIKRALQGSAQGAREFKSEIELLSRIHHKNVVGLAGFCFDRVEQMLVKDWDQVRLDEETEYSHWSRGLQYLHDLVSPPIIHRDIKSNNILLDGNLNAKVADFGLSRFLGEKGHITTQVKGTMGYMDPEYYMTNQLTEKSDVFSFGVVLLEIVTGKVPIDKGRYIVKEVKDAMDMTKDLYNLHEILDPAVRSGATPRGLEEFVVLALKCVEEGGVNRPKMSEVVKQIENIMEIERLNPYADYASTSATYEGANKGLNHPYTESLFVYSEA